MAGRQPSEEEMAAFAAEYHAKMASLIEKNGFAVSHVSGDIPYSYSAGMSGHLLPDLLMMGLPPDTSHHLINTIAQRLMSGELVAADGLIVTEVANMPLRLKSLPAAGVSHIMLSALRHAALNSKRNPDFTPQFMQVVYPDREGRFPDNPDCDPLICSVQDTTSVLLQVDPEPNDIH